MIGIKSLTKRFGEQVVFNKVSMQIPLGRTTIVTGKSGCGKTTLLRIIAGLDHKYHGKVTGVPKTISFMFQEDRLLPWFTLKENIAFVLKDIMEKPQIDAAVAEMIENVHLIGHGDKYPSKLSGGMKRRVALARTLCYPADLILMDEPFKGLDASLKEDMILLFQRLVVDTNKTAVIVSHDEALINRIESNIITIS